MDYSNYTVFGFCTQIYEKNLLPFDDYNPISTIDMYNFIKAKTENFDLKLFEFLILDIRDYFDEIEFDISNPLREILDDDNPEFLDSAYDTLASLPNTFRINVKEAPKYIDTFENNPFLKSCITLKEKIEELKNIEEIISLCHNISRIIAFSELAENEYKKALKEADTIQNQKNTFTNLSELSSKEFIEYCFKNEVPEIEMYDYLKYKTDGFEIDKIKLFIALLKDYTERIQIYVLKDIEADGVIEKKEIIDYLFGFLNKYAFENSLLETPEAIGIKGEIMYLTDSFDVKQGLKTARRINPHIRPSIEYYSFINILQILENNVKENLFPNKEIANYLDLSLFDFLDALTDYSPSHIFTLSFKDKPEIKEFELKGTYNEIEKTLINMPIPAYLKQELLIKFHSLIKPRFQKEITEIDTYNYFEKITNSFDPDKSKIVFKEMDMYYNMFFLERIQEESINIYNCQVSQGC